MNRQNKALTQIVKLCVILDSKAAEIYSRLATLTKDRELIQFWTGMAREEKEHVRFWKKVLRLAEKEKLPQIFENPEAAQSELETLDKKIDSLLEQCVAFPNDACAFLLAYRLESHLIHFVFEAFFTLMSAISDERNPGDTYEEHIDHLVGMLMKYGADIPEIDILGETLQRLWKKNRELARRSTLDELTGILNRRGFIEAVGPLSCLAQRNHYQVAVLMADIDDFKKINDRWGHEKGDEALKIAARSISSGIRASDIVARYGGEEFIIFLPSVKKNALFEIGEKIRKKVAAASKKHGGFTISIGMAAGRLQSEVDQDLFDLINRADQALYEAKQTGKNKVVIRD